MTYRKEEHTRTGVPFGPLHFKRYVRSVHIRPFRPLLTSWLRPLYKGNTNCEEVFRSNCSDTKQKRVTYCASHMWNTRAYVEWMTSCQWLLPSPLTHHPPLFSHQRIHIWHTNLLVGYCEISLRSFSKSSPRHVYSSHWRCLSSSVI
jgi:hypothetical protein